jgi:hypothetical protein
MQAENPVLALRQEIANTALWHADYQVLAMTAQDKAESFYAGCPFVSDELQHHLSACVEHHDHLREYWWRVRNSSLRDGHSLDDVVFHYCQTNALVGQFYAKGFNLMRATYKDTDTVGRDWFRPLILSSIIYAEDNFRSKVCLPSLLDKGDSAFYPSRFRT